LLGAQITLRPAKLGALLRQFLHWIQHACRAQHGIDAGMASIAATLTDAGHDLRPSLFRRHRALRPHHGSNGSQRDACQAFAYHRFSPFLA
jgi:hypothetical protein